MIWHLISIINSLILIAIYPFYISFDEKSHLTQALKEMQ